MLGTMVVAAPVCRPGKHLTTAAFEDEGMPWASRAGSLFLKLESWISEPFSVSQCEEKGKDFP